MTDVIFKGGAGTPAIYAMLGGQRYLVANILWAYSDMLFHDGKPYEMVQPMESCVTLNPTFLEAWSVYGWHLAWNLHTYTDDVVLKAKYLTDGEQVYLRALFENKDKPRPYFDLAWLYMQRMGEYEKARNILEAVVYNTGTITVEGETFDVPKTFKPYTLQELKDFRAGRLVQSEELEKKWMPSIQGHRLAYLYKKLGIIQGDPELFKKAISTYEYCLEVDPTDEAATNNIKDLKTHMYDKEWLAEQREAEAKHRDTYGMSPSTAMFGSDAHSGEHHEGDGHDHHGHDH
jgi:tetratricopeptide (TPR) repeat protein